MNSSLPLQFWYVSVQLLSAAILTATGYWVYAKSDIHHRMVFVALTGAQFCWVIVAIGKLLVQHPEAKYALSLLSDLFALLAVGIVGYFATVYTNRSTSLRKPQNAVFVGWFVIGVGGILTQPLLGLQYESVTYRQAPIAYLAIEPGPMYLVNVLATVAILAVSVAYLARLFISSPHRPTSSILLLGVAAALSLLPNAVSTFTTVPLLPGYDYSVFGIVPVTVVLAYVVFFRGELDLAPMARDEIVDEIDDALFGLDDAGRVIDYNAAARALLPPDAEEPVGTTLETLLPGLAEEISLPSTPDGDVTETYSTAIDGARTHYSVSVTPINERGTVAGYSVILRDVTAVESAKRELKRQNEQLEAFAATVAHDLRNPLTVADGTSMLLADSLRNEDPPIETGAIEHLDRVNSAISRMDAVLNELQTLAEHAQSVTDTEEIAFEAAVLSAWEQVHTEEMSISVQADGTVDAEPTRLYSILETLFRYSAEHDGTAVAVELTDSGFIYEDDGKQIPESEHEAVFEHDTTTSTATPGLGLKIVHTEVESQGWTVVVEPSADGSRFNISGAKTRLSTATEEGNPL